jgi:transposase InsO family protein
VLTLNHGTRLFGVALVVLACYAPAVAEDYPSRPVTLIIPFPAGGGVDTIGRVIAAKLTAALGQQVIVDQHASCIARDEAKADVFDYIEHFYNPKRRHSTIGYLSSMKFERQAGFA